MSGLATGASHVGGLLADVVEYKRSCRSRCVRSPWKGHNRATLTPPSLLFTQNENAEKDKLLNYNSAELEDCDLFPEASFSITHFDESLRPRQVVSGRGGAAASPASEPLALASL